MGAVIGRTCKACARALLAPITIRDTLGAIQVEKSPQCTYKTQEQALFFNEVSAGTPALLSGNGRLIRELFLKERDKASDHIHSQRCGIVVAVVIKKAVSGSVVEYKLSEQH